MKTKSDPRHLTRRKIIRELFAKSFTEQKYLSETTQKILENLREIDSKISQSASERPMDNLNKIDLAILRLAVYELLYDKIIPSKVVIDEAVELAKEFGGENSPSFINGALGDILTKLAK